MNINFFMKEAIIEAKKAFKKNEVPIGGLIIDNKTHEILARGHNMVNISNNAINHCEIFLIFNACKKLKSKYLNETTLFVTLEPCTMCAAAISKVHISNIYFGAYDEKNGGIEKLLIAYKRDRIFFPEIYGGILEKENQKLLKNFFINKRV